MVCVHVLCVCVCQRCRRNGQASAGSYLCVTGRGTMQGIDAKPTATLQGYSAFYSPHSSKRQKIFLSLPLRLSLRSHCILWSVLLFKCSYSPFRKRATFKPTVTMATPICIWKSAFEGANEMCNNMPRHCASLSKYSKYGHMKRKCLICFCFYCFICFIYINKCTKKTRKRKRDQDFRNPIFSKYS